MTTFRFRRLLFPFSLLFSVACSNVQPDRKLANSCTTKITIPETLMELKSFNDSSITVRQKLRKANYWIITFDAECSLCIAQLSSWSKIIRSIKDTSNFAFIFLPYGTSVATLNFALTSSGFNYPVFFDQDKSYYMKNRLYQYPERESVLVDSGLCLRVEGSPVKQQGLLEIYLQDLK
jgi:hypothetical protein